MLGGVSGVRPGWVHDDVDLEKPSPARMYDALLGGSHNFEVDRRAAAEAVALVPDLTTVALNNRAFLRRAVRYLLDAGVRQFVDVGAGIPTAANTHELAPEAKVAYIDIDPVAVAHAEAILADQPLAIALRGDLREPDDLLGESRLREFIDFEQPVGVLLIAVLHLLTDDDHPHAAVATLRDHVAAGSYLAVSHLSSAHRPEAAATLATHSAQRSRVPITFRPRAQIGAFFEGFALVEPGIVEIPAWHPDPHDPPAAGRSLGLAGVGRR
jgi:hypothetical protein